MTPLPHHPVGVFDSGVGGLTVANAIFGLLPKEQLIYFGDSGRAPYGGKPADVIRAYSAEITQFLLEQGCKAIVVACNTATVAALDYLRDTFPRVPFVGMEPAVKPATQASKTHVIGVMATLGTIQSPRYLELIEKYASHCSVLEDPCLGLVKAIEEGALTEPKTERLLRHILLPMLEQDADTIVLGCTHFPMVEPLIQSIIGADKSIIDPAPAVARQLQRLLVRKGLLSNRLVHPPLFYTSGDTTRMQAIALQYLKQVILPIKQEIRPLVN